MLWKYWMELYDDFTKWTHHLGILTAFSREIQILTFGKEMLAEFVIQKHKAKIGKKKEIQFQTPSVYYLQTIYS